VEIPTEVSWANLPGADRVEINNFSALAQFDFYMQVQKHYTAHNTSATVEFREHEIKPLAQAIHHAIDNGDGYISAALLARFDANATFPRLPFEPIDAATYHRLSAEVEAGARKETSLRRCSATTGANWWRPALPAVIRISVCCRWRSRRGDGGVFANPRI
jgi:ribonucleotide reductase class II